MFHRGGGSPNQLRTHTVVPECLNRPSGGDKSFKLMAVYQRNLYIYSAIHLSLSVFSILLPCPATDIIFLWFIIFPYVLYLHFRTLVWSLLVAPTLILQFPSSRKKMRTELVLFTLQHVCALSKLTDATFVSLVVSLSLCSTPSKKRKTI